MVVSPQQNLSVEDFYDEINKKLNALISKINMTHKERGIAEAIKDDASNKALHAFVTGLVLYASNLTLYQKQTQNYKQSQTIKN